MFKATFISAVINLTDCLHRNQEMKVKNVNELVHRSYWAICYIYIQVSRILASRIPWTEESGRLQFKGLHRVRHKWNDLACTHYCSTKHCMFIILWLSISVLLNINKIIASWFKVILKICPLFFFFFSLCSTGFGMNPEVHCHECCLRDVLFLVSRTVSLQSCHYILPLLKLLQRDYEINPGPER